jgi:hypothetical protein
MLKATMLCPVPYFYKNIAYKDLQITYRYILIKFVHGVDN